MKIDFLSLKILSLKYILVLIPLFFVCSNNIFAQNNYYEQKYRLAESFEKGGELESAVQIYQEIYAAMPTNKKYFEALVRVLKQQNRYSELKTIVEEKTKTEKSVDLFLLSGEVYWKLGETSSANKAWDNVLSLGIETSEVYLRLSSLLASLKLFDKAVNVLKSAKSKYPKDLTVSDALARLYVITGNYKDGINEILYLFNSDKNLPLTQGRIYTLLSNPEAVEYADKAFQKEMKVSGNNLQLLSLYSWFLRVTKQFEKALDIVEKIESVSKTRGLKLYKFGEDSKRDGEYDIALKAFQKVISMGKNTDYRHAALFMYTQTVEEKMQSSNNVTKEETRKIIDSYKDIIKEFPRSRQEVDCRVRIAELENTVFNNTAGAIEELQKVVDLNYNSLTVIEALNKLSEIYIKTNELKLSEDVVNKVLNKYGRQTNNITADELDKSRYLKGELLFYREEIDSALAIFKELSVNKNTDIANDALDKIVLIEQNREHVAALNMYSKAELAEMQNNIAAAKNYYQNVVQYAPNEQIGEQSLIKAAEIDIKQSNYDEANKILSQYLNDNIYPMFGDNALFLLGNIAEKQNDKERAIDYYSKLLANYTNSLFLIEARNRIKELRVKV